MQSISQFGFTLLFNDSEEQNYKSADEKTHDFNRVDDSPQIF